MITRGDLAYPGFVVAGLETVFRDTFNSSLLTQQAPRIATTVPVTAPIVNYPFLGAPPHMKELRDRMDDQGIDPYMVTIQDKEWEANMRISAKALEDDATGMYRMQATQMGLVAARFDDEQAFGALDAGFTGTGANGTNYGLAYDATTFFSSVHNSGGSGNQSNTTTATLSSAALQAAFGVMGTWLDDKGRPFGTTPDTLVVGPLNAMRGREIIQSPIVVQTVGSGTIGTGATTATNYGNVLQGMFNLVVSPWVTGYHWFLVDSKQAIKPIIIQERSDVPLQTWNDTDDPAARRRREYNFTAFQRKGFGYGPWQTAYGSNATS